MKMTANEMKSLARDQIWGVNDFFGVWEKTETLQAAINNISEFFESESRNADELPAVLEVGDAVVAEILLDDAKDRVDGGEYLSIN